MNKLVYQVFKAIAFSMIFIFVWDMIFYLYRAMSLNARMESISTSLRKVVMENDYLPSEDAEVFKEILAQLYKDFNHVNDVTDIPNPYDEFIVELGWNYYKDPLFPSGIPTISAQRKYYNGSSWSNVNVDIVHDKMSEIGNYGDITVVQLHAMVKQPTWGFTSSTSRGSQDWANDRTSASIAARTTTFTYTYFVPCMKYKTLGTT